MRPLDWVHPLATDPNPIQISTPSHLDEVHLVVEIGPPIGRGRGGGVTLGWPWPCIGCWPSDRRCWPGLDRLAGTHHTCKNMERSLMLCGQWIVPKLMTDLKFTSITVHLYYWFYLLQKERDQNFITCHRSLYQIMKMIFVCFDIFTSLLPHVWGRIVTAT